MPASRTSPGRRWVSGFRPNRSSIRSTHIPIAGFDFIKFSRLGTYLSISSSAKAYSRSGDRFGKQFRSHGASTRHLAVEAKFVSPVD